jgi:hypothetical protein
LLDELVNHVAKNSPHSVKALVRLADVCESNVIEQNFLNDEDGNGLAQLRPCFHDPQAERDDLSCQEEVDHFRGIVLYKCTNDSQRSKSEVLKWSRLGCRVEKRIKEERDVRYTMLSLGAYCGIDVILPLRKRPLVSVWDATHCNNARALQTRFDAAAVNCEGLSRG